MCWPSSKAGRPAWRLGLFWVYGTCVTPFSTSLPLLLCIAQTSLHPAELACRTLTIQPKFLIPAKTHLPFLPRYAISMSLTDARFYFWPSVHGFSVYYSALATPKGQAFLRECKAGGKNVCAWTVNKEEQMRDCARWGVGSVITDKPALWRKVKTQVSTHLFVHVLLPAKETRRAIAGTLGGHQKKDQTFSSAIARWVE